MDVAQLDNKFFKRHVRDIKHRILCSILRFSYNLSSKWMYLLYIKGANW